MPLQDFIHQLTEGSGSRFFKVALVFLGMLGIAVWYDLAAFKNLSTLEGMDAAQLARNLSEGKGFTTEFVRPFSLFLVKRHRADGETLIQERHPDLANAPLYPVTLAGALKVSPFGDPDLSSVKRFSIYTPDLWIAGFNQLLFFVAVWMVFRLGRRLFDEPVAWVSAAVFAGSDLFWRFSISGLSTMLLIGIVLWLMEVLSRMEPETRDGVTTNEGRLVRMAALAGLVTGLAAMTRYSFGWLLIPVAFFIGGLPAPRRAVMVASAVAAFLAVTAPWVIRNWIVSGTLFGTAGYSLLENTVLFSNHDLGRSLNPDFSLMEGGMIWHKFVVGLREILEKELPRLGGSWVSAFFAVGLLVPFRSPTLRRLRGFILGCFVTLILVQALGRTALSTESPEVNSENLIVVLAPGVFLFGVSLFFTLVDQFGLKMPAYRMAVVTILLVLTSAPLWFSLFMPVPSALAYPPYYPPYIQGKAHGIEENDLMMTDMPWATAWYGRRQSVWLSLKYREPAGLKHPNDFFAVNAAGKPVRALYLSSRTTKAVETRILDAWVRREARAGVWEPFVTDWESFVVLGVYVFREVPTGFPLRRASLEDLPELFLLESERNPDKPIKGE
jgi:hypothetical protein